MYSANVKDSENVDDWLSYPPPLYINIGFGLKAHWEPFSILPTPDFLRAAHRKLIYVILCGHLRRWADSDQLTIF